MQHIYSVSNYSKKEKVEKHNFPSHQTCLTLTGPISTTLYSFTASLKQHQMKNSFLKILQFTQTTPKSQKEKKMLHVH